ncbi:MAG: TlpA family protein disulfide reductase, partial [Gammaproteobacteria bacterium]
ELIVLGVDFDAPSTATAAMASIEKMGIEFPVLTLDPAMNLGIDTPTVLPTTVLVHPDGEVREVLVGPQTAASLLAVINPVTSGAE